MYIVWILGFRYLNFSLPAVSKPLLLLLHLQIVLIRGQINGTDTITSFLLFSEHQHAPAVTFSQMHS